MTILRAKMAPAALVALSLSALLATCNRNPTPTEAPVAAPVPAPGPAPVVQQRQAPGTELAVLTVESLMVSRRLDSPTTIVVQATGTTNSAGWGNPHLVAVDAAAGGDPQVRTYRFVATSPTAVAAQVIQPVETTIEINAPTGVSAIRVVAATNEISATVGTP